MIKMSLEVPIKYLQKTEQRVDFHFCIASTAIRHPEYLRFYKRKARECAVGKSDRFVMLDNGAYEAFAGGPPMVGVEELVELVDKLKPQVVWAPDVMFNRHETVKLTTKLASEMRAKNNRHTGVLALIYAVKRRRFLSP